MAGPGGNFANFEICRTSIEIVSRGGRDTIHVMKHSQRLNDDEVVRRALQLVGRRGYDLLFDNCEHFAVWCVRGSEESRQVHAAFERLGAAGTKAVAAGLAKAAGRVGTRGLVRGASPWILAADAAQWATEFGGHWVGAGDEQQRRTAGRFVGVVTSIGVGAMGGPVGAAIAGGLWVAGEVMGEASRAGYEKIRETRVSDRDLGLSPD